MPNDLPRLILAVLSAFFGLYHLLIFHRHRRSQAEYGWFGLLAVLFGVAIFASSVWVREVIPSPEGVLRLREAAIHGIVAVFIQFLWLMLERPIGPLLRCFQLSHAGLAVLVAAGLPAVLVAPLRPLRWLWLVPFLIATGWVVLRGIRRGHPEARTVGLGGLFIAAAGLHQLADQFFDLGWWGRQPLPALAFSGLTLTMAIAMADRFRRLHGELDELRRNLDQKVEERTEELQRRHQEVVAGYEELRRLQQEAERVFTALADALPGRVLDGKYRLEEKIGSGGHGAVYRATHLGLHRPVAVKIFQPVFRPDDPRAALRRFRLEGVSACRVEHPNAVAVLDSGIAETGIAYLVMELLEGHDLAREIRQRGALPLPRCAEILTPVCDVLAVAETAGVVHRDIKPENIFLHRRPDGEVVKVVDFGIAKLMGDAAFGGLPAEGAVTTLLSHPLGTPAYMAPERLMNEPHDHRADVYSLGVVLYEMISGRSPYRKESGEIDYRRLFTLQPPPPLHPLRPDLPGAAEAVVMRALSAEPGQRPAPRELARQFATAVGG